MSASAALVQAGSTPGPADAFPFAFHDHLIWVAVKVPGADRPLQFLLDSGAGASVLNLATARRLRIRLADPVLVHGVHTQAVGYWSPRITAWAGEVPLHQQFLVVDLDALGRDCHCALDGLLGADFFCRRVVQIDFEACQVRLLGSAVPTATSEVLPLVWSRSALVVPVRVNAGRRQWVRLDTGCASALEWVRTGQPPADAVPRLSIGLAQVTIPTVLTSVELGRLRFDRVSTGLHPRRIFPGEAGLLGNGLLSRFTVTVDAPVGRLVLNRRAEGERF